jgi:hypothetical protein
MKWLQPFPLDNEGSCAALACPSAYNSSGTLAVRGSSAGQYALEKLKMDEMDGAADISHPFEGANAA